APGTVDAGGDGGPGPGGTARVLPPRRGRPESRGREPSRAIPLRSAALRPPPVRRSRPVGNPGALGDRPNPACRAGERDGGRIRLRSLISGPCRVRLSAQIAHHLVQSRGRTSALRLLASEKRPEKAS